MDEESLILAKRSWSQAPDEHIYQAVDNIDDYDPGIRQIILEEAEKRGKTQDTETTKHLVKQNANKIESFQVKCPYCHVTLKASKKVLGKTLPCPKCEKPIKIKGHICEKCLKATLAPVRHNELIVCKECAERLAVYDEIKEIDERTEQIAPYIKYANISWNISALVCLITGVAIRNNLKTNAPEAFSFLMVIFFLAGAGGLIFSIVNIPLSIENSRLKKRKEGLKENLGIEKSKPEQTKEQACSLAKASLVFLFLGFMIPIIMHIVSIICGVKALKQIEGESGTQKSRKFALWGIWASSVFLFFWILVIFTAP